MAINHAHKELVWQSFSSHFDELQALQDKIREIETHYEEIKQQIEAKKRVIERATGLPWEEIQTTLVVSTSHNGPAQLNCSSKKATVLKEGTIRQWVLRAIAHYEDNNPQSRIDKSSIRIYIDAEAPGFLENYSPNAIYFALRDLKSKGLVITAPGRETNHDRSRYCLTTKGRAVL